MQFYSGPPWCVLLLVTLNEIVGADDDYNVIHRDGSYEFGYNNPDSYHYADANRNNVVKGEFGARNPATGAIDSTIYTAGPRGFRPRGKNIVRKYDLNQNGPRPVGSRDDPYYDPFEDPSYNFSFKTRTYTRQESANRVGDVNGKYSYVDDVGERHNVEFTAGKNTGFHVKTPFPDSNPRSYGPLYFNGRGKPIPRGRTSIQQGLDGSYRFVSAGPDQRRTETSDSTGHVRGSYTYLDDKGVQHSVHYIAGPETGYRVLKNVKGPHLPTLFPFGRPGIIPPDFYDYGKDDDVFNTAASGHVKPSAGKQPGSKGEEPALGQDENKDDFSLGSRPSKPTRPIKPTGPNRPVRPGKPSSIFGGINGGDLSSPSPPEEDTDDFGDLFGGAGGANSAGSVSGAGRPGSVATSSSSSESDFHSTTVKPGIATSNQGGSKPGLISEEEDGSYKPTGDNGSYKPSVGISRPSFGTSTTKPGGSGIVGTTFPQGLPRPISTEKPGKRPTGGNNLGVGFGNRPGKPTTNSDDRFGSNEVHGDLGLFGSETSNARPPYGTRPVIHVGGTDEGCDKCKGTIVTNVGDKLFSVPPGVSVRAHVQAIDLIPINPKVPSPSEQYKTDTSLRTEQLNESTNNIIRNCTEDTSEESITEPTITTTLVPITEIP